MSRFARVNVAFGKLISACAELRFAFGEVYSEFPPSGGNFPFKKLRTCANINLREAQS